ncbi:aminopeptidase [Wenzhouxiangella sp. AB-CW3]|uniref:aminopeptidase n=1 Tax=Wenzhouxiangella sp. AB-CW3 TaxID=2771012 RepID=UPI00168AEBEF|nr:aminopeptidase [Wenzhouxiangella sp. AB-CW3]QOC22926.1 aminopeptidase [Wenzhouxiangella sp. AB-CW3]
MSKSIFLAFCILWLSGCATVGWYGQAARGQMEMLCKRQPIEQVLADPETPETLREQLEVALAARAFAVTELGLPDSRSYTYYADLERDAAVWNVVATPRFSMDPKTWCYPLVGCLAYRGYFRDDSARRQADRLEKQGLDVAVMPAVAYSTLGWFADPVLNTMLARDEVWLVGLIFHELAHEKLFVRGDTAFNEAYAGLIEREGVRRWLRSRGEQQRLARWEEELALHTAFIKLLLEARLQLEALYEEGGPEEALADNKKAVFEDLRERIRAFASANDRPVESRWLDGEINNAHLASVATYEAGIEAFARRLDETCDGDLHCLHTEAAEMAEWTAARRARFLAGED